MRDFAALIQDPAPGDPGVRRLVPAAYEDDAEAAEEFRRLTAGDLLAGRGAESAVVSDCLTEALATGANEGPRTLTIARTQLGAWIRTLAGVRLVLAERLGVSGETPEDDHEDDPRHIIYAWLGYRLDRLLSAADASPSGQSDW